MQNLEWWDCHARRTITMPVHKSLIGQGRQRTGGAVHIFQWCPQAALEFSAWCKAQVADGAELRSLTLALSCSILMPAEGAADGCRSVLDGQEANRTS